MTISYFFLKLIIMKQSVPIPIIQQIVSDVSNTSVSDILMPSGSANARKQSIVMPRQVSMALSKKYTMHSFQTIGEMHGGRDHATVMHSVRMVKNGLETNYETFINLWTESSTRIDAWIKYASRKYKKNQPNGSQIPLKLKLKILRSMILNEVELDKRQEIFNTVYTEKDKRFKYDRYSIETLPGRMQKSNKRKI
jgi:hypothetical protein